MQKPVPESTHAAASKGGAPDSGVAAASRPASNSPTDASELASRDADDGKDVYKKKCQSCHGANGEKTTYKDVTFPALTDKKVQAESDADLKKESAEGKTGKMGSVKGMSAQDLSDVVAFMRSLK